MAVYQCRMCHANLRVKPGQKTVTCEYCGTVQTIPQDEIRTVVIHQEAPDAKALIRRAELYLEDEEYESAAECLELALEQEPENARGWMVSLCEEIGVASPEELSRCTPADEILPQVLGSGNYRRALRFAGPELKHRLESAVRALDEAAGGWMEREYRRACTLAESESPEKTEEAGEILELLGEYRDAPARAQECEDRTERLRRQEKDRRSQAQEERYQQAEKRFRQKKWQQAEELFSGLGLYRDSFSRAEECRKKQEEALRKRQNRRFRLILSVLALVLTAVAAVGMTLHGVNNAAEKRAVQEAAELMQRQEYRAAAGALTRAGDQEEGLSLRRQCAQKLGAVTLAAGGTHAAAVQTDGTPIGAGANEWGQKGVTGWRNITALSAGDQITMGLDAVGQVHVTGYNQWEQRQADGWQQVSVIACGDRHSAAVGFDGRVRAVGDDSSGQCQVEDWRNVVFAAVGGSHTVGLTDDGRVLAAGDNAFGQCAVEDWQDVMSLSAGEAHTVGLLADGTVLAAGDNRLGQCAVDGWENIALVSAGKYHTVGLTSDGRVLAAGDDSFGQCRVQDWENITAVSAGDSYTLGLTEEGTVLLAGTPDPELYLEKWTDLLVPDSN